MADVVSSQQLIKSVAKKLKRYIDVKRREEGFDLSTTLEPGVQQLTFKPRSLTATGTSQCHRDVKHYFHDPEVRKRITKPCLCTEKQGRETNIRGELKQNMKKYKIKETFLPEGRFKKDKYGNIVPFRSTAPSSPLHYGQTTNIKPLKAGSSSPALLFKPTAHMSMCEAERMVSTATRLLAYTELNYNDNTELLDRRKHKEVVLPKRRRAYSLHGIRVPRPSTAEEPSCKYKSQALANPPSSPCSNSLRRCRTVEKLGLPKPKSRNNEDEFMWLLKPKSKEI